MSDPKHNENSFTLGVGGALRNAFKQADPPELKAIKGDARKLEQIQQIEKWAAGERAKFGKAVAENRQTWVAEEAARVWEERSMNTLDLRPPHMQGAILSEARHRVQLQIRAGYQNIDQMRRLQRAAITGSPMAEIAQRRDLSGP